MIKKRKKMGRNRDKVAQNMRKKKAANMIKKRRKDRSRASRAASMTII